MEASEMTRPLRTIEIDVGMAGKGSIKIDGMDVSDLTSGFKIDVAAGELAQVTVTFCADDLKVKLLTDDLNITREELPSGESAVDGRIVC
jgi:hypothetical protein